MEKKNVLLYTINDSENPGQIFATYALYKTLEQLGHNPVIADEGRSLDAKMSEYIKGHCSMLSDMHTYSSKDEYVKTFDVLLTGTEKKWKYCEEESVDMSFLNWGKEDAARIAYAPSFGKTCDLPLGPKNAAYFALRRFRRISAADSNTLSILNMDFGVDAEKVCNPILLLDKYPHLEVSEVEGLFISTFFENRDSQKQKAAEMAEETIKYRVLDYSKDSEGIEKTTADEYLDAIEKSSLIITDTAAVMHLAIAYRKPFIVVLSRQENESYECLSTLEELGLTERVIYVEDDVREKKYLCRKPIKYGLADVKLSNLRKKSIAWLENSLR